MWTIPHSCTPFEIVWATSQAGGWRLGFKDMSAGSKEGREVGNEGWREQMGRRGERLYLSLFMI